jgi:hypothetical protein
MKLFCKHDWTRASIKDYPIGKPASQYYHIGYYCRNCKRMCITTWKTRFWNWLCGDNNQLVVRVISLQLVWDEYHKAFAWPELLVDSSNGKRQSTTPIWTKSRYQFWKRNKI